MRGAWLVLLAGSMMAQTVVLDRIAATVGKQVIPESDVLRSLRIVAFLDQKPVELSGEAKRKAAERMVDQMLILREAVESRTALAGPEVTADLLSQVKRQFATQAELEAALAKYDITEQEVSEHLLASYRTLRFTDGRFRPEVQVTEEDLREFYQLLAAGWRSSPGVNVPTFEDAREQVEKLLVDQRAMQALDAWLSTARSQQGVAYRDRVFE